MFENTRCEEMGSAPKRSLLWVLLGLPFLILPLASCAGAAPTPNVGPQRMVDIGYGEIPERDVTGAISSLEVEKNDFANYRNIAELLRDRVPGVDVLETPYGPQVRVRGVRSLMGNNAALVVINGTPVGPAGLAQIAPGTVASVSVLKDAGSTAMYGSRGANGVIVIRTKSSEAVRIH